MIKRPLDAFSSGRLRPKCTEKAPERPQCGADTTAFLSDVYNRSTRAQKRLVDVPQSGRSMIEMLGVLAIVGVLSVGGIAGYSKAMEQYQSNQQKQQIENFLFNIISLKDQLNVSIRNNNDTSYLYTAPILEALDMVPDGMTHNNGGTFYGAGGLKIITTFQIYESQIAKLIYFSFPRRTEASPFSPLIIKSCVNALLSLQKYSSEIKTIELRQNHYTTVWRKQKDITSVPLSEIHKVCRNGCKDAEYCTILSSFW